MPLQECRFAAFDFEAKRTFMAYTAQELRNPIAGATQAQLLQTETSDRQAAQHPADIEVTLKRLARLSEKLQLARAEGRQRSDRQLTCARSCG
jgi:two-component system, OmpR family, sensor kinase